LKTLITRLENPDYTSPKFENPDYKLGGNPKRLA